MRWRYGLEDSRAGLTLGRCKFLHGFSNHQRIIPSRVFPLRRAIPHYPPYARSNQLRPLPGALLRPTDLSRKPARRGGLPQGPRTWPLSLGIPRSPFAHQPGVCRTPSRLASVPGAGPNPHAPRRPTLSGLSDPSRGTAPSGLRAGFFHHFTELELVPRATTPAPGRLLSNCI